MVCFSFLLFTGQLKAVGIERNGHELDGLGEGADELLGSELDEGSVGDLAGDDSL